MKYEPINDLARQELNDIKRIGKFVRGRQELIDHLAGKALPSALAAVRAHCYWCMGYHSDERATDCEEKTCPLYQYNPYGSDPAPKPKRSPKTERQMAAFEKARAANPNKRSHESKRPQ
jgi:hypothetical protein